MMKHFIKRLLKHDKLHHLLAWLGALYIRIIMKTGRMHSHIPDASKPYFNGEKPAIFVMWHSRMLLMQSHAPTMRPMHALVSAHSDGRMIGRVLKQFGINSVHGSTSKGGSRALRILINFYHQGHNISITPDGPRGPACTASSGVAQLAMLANAPVICVAYAATRHIRLKSWDRFMIALPFSPLHFVAANPILYDPLEMGHNKTGREHLRITIEHELNNVTDTADTLANNTLLKM